MRHVEANLALQAREQGAHAEGEAGTAKGGGAHGAPDAMKRHARPELALEVDVLDGHVQAMPARGQAGDEAVRREPVTVGPMVGQQRRRVNDEDRKRLGHDAGIVGRDL